MNETDTPSWGIEPVPERLRVLGVLDGLLLWSNLSVSLLVIVAGAFLVLPASEFGLALSLPEALGAIVAAALVGNLLLGLGGLIGADARVPTMVLMRAPLGRRGSYLPTGLNVVQCLGWSVFELIIIATGASALSQQVLRLRRPRRSGRSSSARSRRGSRFSGPVGFVRRYVRKFAIWVVIASLVYLCWWSLHGQHPVRLWHRGGAHAFWPGFDLVLASIISWTPLVADYTRFSRTRRAGFWSAGLGYLLPTIPLFALGARDRDVAAHQRRAGIADRGRRGRRREPARAPRADRRRERRGIRERLLRRGQPAEPAAARAAAAARGGVAAVATVGALLIDLRNYQPFLYLLGSFFVPLFAVLLADWLLPGRHYDADAVFRVPELRRGDGRRLARRLLPLPVALPARARLVDEPRRPCPSARLALGRRVGAELRRRVRARDAGAAAGQEAYSRERVIALIGNLSRDLLPGRPPHVGGGPYHGARALQRLRVPARIVARCAVADRELLLPPVVQLGTPVRYVAGESTASSRSPTTATVGRWA